MVGKGLITDLKMLLCMLSSSGTCIILFHVLHVGVIDRFNIPRNGPKENVLWVRCKAGYFQGVKIGLKLVGTVSAHS